ncbi:MAG TPA: hypothetical protein VF395_14875 [Polyangiaceae bacterium]
MEVGRSEFPIGGAVSRDLGWAARLVAADGPGDLVDLGRRAAAGLGLSALYGVALGARQGGRALLIHAAGVPLGLLLVAVIGAPSMFVFLSLCRAPIDGNELASTTARGLGSAGLLLAGLAPAVALFVVSSETPLAAASVVRLGLLLGGGVALARTVSQIARLSYRGAVGSVVGGAGVAIGFAVFAVLLALRVWNHVLPILGGAS